MVIDGVPLPLTPIWTVAWLATVWPLVKLMTEAVGAALPVGNAVRKPCPPALVAVMLTTAAVALTGTAEIGTTSEPPGATWPVAQAKVPVPVRVSQTREGETGT